MREVGPFLKSTHRIIRKLALSYFMKRISSSKMLHRGAHMLLVLLTGLWEPLRLLNPWPEQYLESYS